MAIIISIMTLQPVVYADTIVRTPEVAVTKIDEKCTLYTLQFDEVNSMIYEYVDNECIQYDIYEGDIHDIIEIVNGELIVNGNRLVIDSCVDIEVNQIFQDSAITYSSGQWLHNYGTSPFGGIDADYNSGETTKTVTLNYKTKDLAGLAISSICTIIGAAAKWSITQSLAVGLFTYAVQQIKTVDQYASENNAYMSFKQTTKTNTNVNTALAFYYKHTFEFYSGPELSGTSIVTNTPVYEIYFLT